MSEVAQRVTELASDPDSSAAVFVELVHRDPGIASELLRYANSAALAARVEIVSVRQAVVHLGIQRVSQVALAASLRSGVFDAQAYAGLAKLHWTHSIATALVAKRIARLLTENVEVAFLCGLLWRIGATLVLRAIGEFAEGASLPDEDEADLLADELNERFREAASEAWNLPTVVARALTTRTFVGEKPIEACIASLAHDIAPQLLSDEPLDIEAYTARPEAECLNLYPEHFDELAALAEELRAELEAMP